MTPATPYSACANGCGVPAKWKVKRGKLYRNLCNSCVTKSHDRMKGKIEDTKDLAERKRKAEVLGRLGYNRKFAT